MLTYRRCGSESPTLQDWLPEGHLVYFVSDAMDALDLSAFHAHYAEGDRRRQPCVRR